MNDPSVEHSLDALSRAAAQGMTRSGLLRFASGLALAFAFPQGRKWWHPTAQSLALLCGAP